MSFVARGENIDQYTFLASRPYPLGLPSMPIYRCHRAFAPFSYCISYYSDTSYSYRTTPAAIRWLHVRLNLDFTGSYSPAVRGHTAGGLTVNTRSYYRIMLNVLSRLYIRLDWHHSIFRYNRMRPYFLAKASQPSFVCLFEKYRGRPRPPSTPRGCLHSTCQWIL